MSFLWFSRNSCLKFSQNDFFAIWLIKLLNKRITIKTGTHLHEIFLCMEPVYAYNIQCVRRTLLSSFQCFTCRLKVSLKWFILSLWLSLTSATNPQFTIDNNITDFIQNFQNYVSDSFSTDFQITVLRARQTTPRQAIKK